MPWRENEGKANKVKGSTPEGGDIGTGPCPDELQGAAYIGTLTFPLSLQMRVKSTEGGHMPSYLSILKNSSSI